MGKGGNASPTVGDTGPGERGICLSLRCVVDYGPRTEREDFLNKLSIVASALLGKGVVRSDYVSPFTLILCTPLVDFVHWSTWCPPSVLVTAPPSWAPRHGASTHDDHCQSHTLTHVAHIHSPSPLLLTHRRRPPFYMLHTVRRLPRRHRLTNPLPCLTGTTSQSHKHTSNEPWHQSLSLIDANVFHSSGQTFATQHVILTTRTLDAIFPTV